MQRESSFSPSHLEVAHSCHQDSLHWGPHTSQSQSGHLDFHNRCPIKTELYISHLIAIYNTISLHKYDNKITTMNSWTEPSYSLLVLPLAKRHSCLLPFYSSEELPVFLLFSRSPFTSRAQSSSYGSIACFPSQGRKFLSRSSCDSQCVLSLPLPFLLKGSSRSDSRRKLVTSGWQLCHYFTWLTAINCFILMFSKIFADVFIFSKKWLSSPHPSHLSCPK